MKKDKYKSLDSLDLYIRVRDNIECLDNKFFINILAALFLISLTINPINILSFLLLPIILILCIASIYLYFNYNKIYFKKCEKKYANRIGKENWVKISKSFKNDNYTNQFTKNIQMTFAIIISIITLLFIIQNFDYLSITRLLLKGIYVFALVLISSDYLYYFKYKRKLPTLTRFLKEDILNKDSEVKVEEFDQLVQLENQHFNKKNKNSINSLQENLKNRLKRLNIKHKGKDIIMSTYNPIYNKKMALQKALIIIRDQKKAAHIKNFMIITTQLMLLLAIPLLILSNLNFH